MATHDYIISNASGAAVRADLNNALAAIVSNNSNATSPSTTYAFQFWADTTTSQLKIRNAANSAWITLMELDGTMLMEDGTVSAPGLAFASDTNTGFFRSAADKINFATGGAERLEIGSSEVVFNDPSNDVDFRVESNGKTHMLFVDAGNDRVGVGDSAPDTTLHVTNSVDNSSTLGSNAGATLLVENSSASGFANIKLANASNANNHALVYGTTTSGSLRIMNNTAERMRIDSSGNVGINTTSPQQFLHVHGTNGRIQITSTGTGSASGDGALFGYDGSDDLFINNREATNFKIFNNGSEQMRIDSSGNVGIGKTSSGNKLEIEGQGDTKVVIDARTDEANGSNAVLELFSKNSSGANNFGFIDYDGDGNFEIGSGGSGAGSVPLVFKTNANERLRIDSSGRLLVGTSSSEAFNGTPSALQIEGTSDATTRISLFRTANDNGSSVLVFAKARNTSHALLNNNDTIGKIEWYGADGNDTNQRAAIIAAEVDGPPSGNDMPGRLVFSTTADGASSPTERMRITSAGKVGIGVSAPIQKLQLHENSSGASVISFTNNTTGDGISDGLLVGLDSTEDGLVFMKESQAIIFGTSNTERMRIASGGEILIGRTSQDNTALGFGFHNPTSTAASFNCTNTTNTGGARVILVNRQQSDGTLIDFRQANTSEGAISVSGSTVSLIGGHLSRWSQTLTLAEHTDLLRGTVLTNLDEMCEWRTSDGELEENEQLNKMAVSSVEGDSNVAGVLVTIDDDNDLDVAMTGDFIIRIAQGTTVARGDLLMSAGDGTAKPQGDDIVRSKTIAKVTSTTVSTTYSDGSYCVPCVLMAC